jgi:hypothetical protein
MRMASDAEQRISRVKGGVRAGRVKGGVRAGRVKGGVRAGRVKGACVPVVLKVACAIFGSPCRYNLSTPFSPNRVDWEYEAFLQKVFSHMFDVPKSSFGSHKLLCRFSVEITR